MRAQCESSLVDLPLHLVACFDRRTLFWHTTQQEGIMHPIGAGLDSRSHRSWCAWAVCTQPRGHSKMPRLRTSCWVLQRSPRQLGPQFSLDFHWSFPWGSRCWASGKLTLYNVPGVAAGPVRTSFFFALVPSHRSTQQVQLQSKSVCAGHCAYILYTSCVDYIYIVICMYTYSSHVQCSWSSLYVQSWSLGRWGVSVGLFVESCFRRGTSVCGWVRNWAQIFRLGPVSNQDTVLCGIRSFVSVLRNCSLIL